MAAMMATYIDGGDIYVAPYAMMAMMSAMMPRRASVRATHGSPAMYPIESHDGRCAQRNTTRMTMPYDPNKHHRRSIRLRGYDYTRRGAYFVTICTHGRECLFGEVAGAEMRLNAYGRIVAECWEAIPAHFDRVELDAFVAMPNHVHAIVVFTTDDVLSQRPVAPAGRPKGPPRHSLGAVVGAFKAAASKRINELRGTAGAPVWLRNYYEQIVRDEADLARIRAYIERNPARWFIRAPRLPAGLR